jgi:hypothetical protein
MLCSRSSRIFTLLLVLVLDTGCRTGRAAPNDATTPGSPSDRLQVQRSYDLLKVDEINAAGIPTAFEAIVRLRPKFLKPPSPPLTTGELRSRQGADELLDERDGRFPTVFVNGVLQGGSAVLRAIPSSSIIDIRHYSPGRVPGRYGIKAPDGLIEVRITQE